MALNMKNYKGYNKFPYCNALDCFEFVSFLLGLQLIISIIFKLINNVIYLQ